ncbi:MAG: GNAT family N-acetyltransferase [Candidatus Staskawiczbacteria bacterium]|nr:GNAT family N-acetyltransferase [Candidatus Staskawiczbacteria bacterium]
MNTEQRQEIREEEPKEKITTYTDEYKEGVLRFYDKLRNEFRDVDLGQSGQGPNKANQEIGKKSENSDFWVATNDENEVVGTAGLDDCGNGIGYFRSLYVDKSLRGKGVAKELLSATVSFAKEKKYKVIFAATMPKNTGVHKFNIKNGFRKIDVPPANSEKFRPGTVFFEMDLGEKKE